MDKQSKGHYRDLIKLIKTDRAEDDRITYYLRLYVDHIIEGNPLEDGWEKQNYAEVLSIINDTPRTGTGVTSNLNR